MTYQPCIARRMSVAAAGPALLLSQLGERRMLNQNSTEPTWAPWGRIAGSNSRWLYQPAKCYEDTWIWSFYEGKSAINLSTILSTYQLEQEIQSKIRRTSYCCSHPPPINRNHWWALDAWGCPFHGWQRATASYPNPGNCWEFRHPSILRKGPWILCKGPWWWMVPWGCNLNPWAAGARVGKPLMNHWLSHSLPQGFICDQPGE